MILFKWFKKIFFYIFYQNDQCQVQLEKFWKMVSVAFVIFFVAILGASILN